MANQKSGTQRKIERKHLILLAVILLLILVALALKNFIIPLLTTIGGFGLLGVISAVDRTFNTDLSGLLTRSIQTFFDAISTAIFHTKGGDKEPPDPRIQTGPDDFVILYKNHKDGEQACNLIQEALQRGFQRRDLAAPVIISPLSWDHLDDFTQQWELAYDQNKFAHCILVISDASLSTEMDGRVDATLLQEQIRASVIKEANAEDKNESQCTLFFLNRAWMNSFHTQLQIPASPQSNSYTLTQGNGNREAAMSAVKRTVQARHCVMLAPPALAAPGASAAPVVLASLPLRVENIPGNPNTFFIDRVDPTAHLVQLFQDIELGKSIHALWGPTGCGKTQIALAFARNYYQELNGENVWNYSIVLWLDTTKSLEKGIEKLNADLASHFRASPSPIAPATWQPFGDFKDIVQWLKSCEVDKHWLLIIDGCNNGDLGVLYPHLSSLQKGHVLLTMKGERPDRLYTDIQTREIGYLLEDEAVNLLVREALVKKDQRKLSSISVSQPNSIKELGMDLSTLTQIEKYWEDARELVRTLGYNPLLIHYVGVSMNRPTGRIGAAPLTYKREYLQQLNKYVQYVQANQTQGDGGEFWNDQEISPVLAVWMMSYKAIKVDAIAHKILLLCAFLSTERIPGEIMERRPGAENVDQTHALTQLMERAILRQESNSGPFSFLYRLEKLVRDIIYLDLDAVVDQANSIEYQIDATRAVYAAFASIMDQLPEKYEYYRPHIGECVGYLEEPDLQNYLVAKRRASVLRQDAFLFLFTVGAYLQQHPEKGESSYYTDEKSVRFTKKGGKSAGASKKVELTAEHLFDLARQLYTKRSPDFRRKSTLPKAAFAKYLYRIALFYHEEFLYRDQGKLAHALDCYRFAVTLVSSIQVSEPLLYSTIHHHLGCLYSYRKEYAKARDHFSLAEKIPTTNDEQKLQVAEVFYSSATNLVLQANPTLYTSARQTYKQALGLLQGFGQEALADPDFARRVRKITRLCRTGKLTILLQESLQIKESSVLKSIAKICALLKECEQDLQQAGTALDYLLLATDLNTLAEAYRRLAQQKWSRRAALIKAREYSLYSLKILEEFKQNHQKKVQQGLDLLRYIWENYQRNSLFKLEDTRTKHFMESQRELLPADIFKMYTKNKRGAGA